MKKLVFGLLVSIASTFALADNVIIERAWTNGLNGAKDSDGVLMKYGKTVNKNLEVDFQYQTVQTETTNAMSTRLEVGLVPSYDLGPVKLYTRAVVSLENSAILLIGMKTSGLSSLYWSKIKPRILYSKIVVKCFDA